MRKVPYEQFVVGLDNLFFGTKIENMEQATERADTIDAYMEACGWTWDDLLSYDQTTHVQASPSN